MTEAEGTAGQWFPLAQVQAAPAGWQMAVIETNQEAPHNLVQVGISHAGGATIVVVSPDEADRLAADIGEAAAKARELRGGLVLPPGPRLFVPGQ